MELKASCRNLRFDESDMATAAWMLEKIRELNKGHKKPNLEKWANELRVTRERDHRTDQEIRDLFEWANDDDFWRANILSPAKLRKQRDTLTIQKTQGGKRDGPKRFTTGPGQRHPDDARADGF